MDRPVQDHEDQNPHSQNTTWLQSESSDSHQKQMEELGGDEDPCQASAQEVDHLDLHRAQNQEVDRQDPHGSQNQDLVQGEENTPEWEKHQSLCS